MTETAFQQAGFVRVKSVPSSPRLETLRRLVKNRGAMIGLGIVALFALAAVFAGQVAPYDPIKAVPREAMQPPSIRHLTGTDHIGRDTLSRIIWGGRLSLSVGLVAVSIAAAIGCPLGLMAGYFRGIVDTVISVAVNLLLAFPSILLALAFISALGPSLTSVMIAVGISFIPHFVRLVRGAAFSIREEAYVESARAIGCPPTHILIRHVLPNIAAPLIVFATTSLSAAILIAAAVSYLGMGAQPPTPEWGVMASDGRSYMRTAWWLTTFPGLAILAVALAVNLLGDGLRDILDPRLRR